jgi:hypothetical protein
MSQTREISVLDRMLDPLSRCLDPEPRIFTLTLDMV